MKIKKMQLDVVKTEDQERKSEKTLINSFE